MKDNVAQCISCTKGKAEKQAVVNKSVPEHICTKGKFISFIKFSGGISLREIECVECGKRTVC
jgi:hypothetical protein